MFETRMQTSVTATNLATVRVLHVIPTMSPSDGGPTTAIASMTRALLAAGVDISVATTFSRSPGESRDEVRARFASELPVHLFPAWPVVQPRGFSPRMAEWLLNHVSDFDLVHLHSMFNWHSLVVPRIAHAKHVAFVIRPLGTLDEWSRSQKTWKKAPYYRVVERRNLRDAAAIHVTSEAEAASVRALGFGEKVRCVPLGVDVPPPSPPRSARHEPLRVLFLSRIHPKKNLPILMEAIGHKEIFQVPPLLTIAGDGDADYVRILRERADSLGISDRVEFVGFADKTMKARLYARCDIFALPSFQENFGIAVAEAMSYGLPAVVSTEVALAKEIRESGGGAVASHTDARGLATALARFEDPEVLRVAAERARALVEEQLSTAAMGRGLVAMYRDVHARS